MVIKLWHDNIVPIKIIINLPISPGSDMNIPNIPHATKVVQMILNNIFRVYLNEQYLLTIK